MEASTEKRFVHFIYNGVPLRLASLKESHAADPTFYDWDALMKHVNPLLVSHDEIANACQVHK